jgi:outer membrane protein assembly factor BamE (lipoprotein component of BamABCDE complex)
MTPTTACSITIAAICLLCGAPSSYAGNSHADKTAKKEAFDRTTPPRMGMSREQVRHLYGEPKYTNQTPRGETWVYTFEGWKFAIPYYGLAAKSKNGVVTFNAQGRVCDYQWGKSRSAFMMGM